ncbi:MAG: antitoxin Xre/MbcA/ParS toxin-binding domain-containing protein [Bacteroidota bacterium]
MGAELLRIKKQAIFELINGFLYKEEYIPVVFLKNFIDAIGSSQNTSSKLLGISTRTLQRELNNKYLSADLSDRFLQIIELYKEGEEAFFNLDTFKNWLNTEKSVFQGKRPFDLIRSTTGIQLVKEEIMRTKFGVLS